MKDAQKTKAQLLTELGILRQQLKGLPTSTLGPAYVAERVSLTPSFAQSTLDALPASLAILDESGTILAVNATWRRFADENAFQGTAYGVGMNYLALCNSVTETDSEDAAAMAQGIREVMARKRNSFTLEYPCHSPDELRWFLARVTGFEDANTLYIVVTHDDMTARWQTVKALSQSEQRYQALVDHIHQGVSITRGGKRLFANAGSCTCALRINISDPSRAV